MNTLVIGCPVAQRTWILPQWFDHVEAACEAAGVTPGYAFVVHPGDPCRAIIGERAPWATIVDADMLRSTDERIWNPERYQAMVGLRNQLLGAVRGLGPPMFLSLDSDILLAPTALMNLLETLDKFDAVGGKCFMTPAGRTCPSWADMGRDGTLVRSDAAGVFPVQVIMAIKLMRPSAYAMDYEFHMQGEDIGWSLAARKAGLELGWDGRVTNKHIVRPDMLTRVDSRVGF